VTLVETWALALAAFLVTVLLVLWRPGGIHEAIPALVGAFLMLLAGLVTRHDVLRVGMVVWNSALTIISTFIMASVLEGAGFFRWVSARLIEQSRGSGRRLFHLVLAFSACLTLFLNNDGSILLGTPIVLGLVRELNLPKRAAFGYLIGACLIASAASPAIGVSNMANLEAMSLVGISLTQHLEATLIPALIGLVSSWVLLSLVFRQTFPATLQGVAVTIGTLAGPLLPHPHAVRHHLPHRVHHLAEPPPHPPRPPRLRRPEPPERFRPGDYPLMWFGCAVVVVVRIGFFGASLLGIAPYVVAVIGAAVLLAANAIRSGVSAGEVIRRAPWAILGFAFGMDLVVFGLRNAGITGLLAAQLGPHIEGKAWGISFLPGLLTATVSTLLNNHPGLIIGSLTLTELHGLSERMLHLSYSGVVLGSDLGALLTPVGTLASLLWFHLLRQNGHRYSWWDYIKISAVVIPASFMLALLGLYGEVLLRGM
jgi:arsenical pump membrane protein